MKRLASIALGALATFGCTVGEGKGNVSSNELYIQDCWNGYFSLGPDFFAANPFRSDALMIRIQRGDNTEELSDGLLIIVNDLPGVRAQLGQDFDVGLPPGVSPPGVPITLNPSPAKISLALYLHNTCHSQNSTIYSVSGTIRFDSLFSGNVNESNAEDRLSKATFTANFTDPRYTAPGAVPDPSVMSVVTGNFEFYFQHGQPAQPFQ